MWSSLWSRAAASIPVAVPAAAAVTGAHLRGAQPHSSAWCEPPCPRPAFSVGCYNVLCPTYAVKWGEREGIGPDGGSNWASRWPAMRDVMVRAQWDVVCLQEVEHTEVADIAAGLGPGYMSHYFKHTKRPPDGVLIAVRGSAFVDSEFSEVQWKGSVAFGRVDMTHRGSGRRVRVVTAHMRGGSAEQLRALSDFADEANEADVTVITGDFNEDFGATRGVFSCPFPNGPLGQWTTLQRETDLPVVSRPPHKQAPDQKSGKGKIDWIFVRSRASSCAVDLFRDPRSRDAILESHASCAATGQWASDHGCEALSVRIASAAARL